MLVVVEGVIAIGMLLDDAFTRLINTLSGNGNTFAVALTTGNDDDEDGVRIVLLTFIVLLVVTDEKAEDDVLGNNITKKMFFIRFFRKNKICTKNRLFIYKKIFVILFFLNFKLKSF